MNIRQINNYNQNSFRASFSPEIQEIFAQKITDELLKNPNCEQEMEDIIQRMKEVYFPNDTYILSKSNKNKSSMYGRLKLQNIKSFIISDLLDTDIRTIEQNIKAMANKKQQDYGTKEAKEKAFRIMDKYC